VQVAERRVIILYPNTAMPNGASFQVNIAGKASTEVFDNLMKKGMWPDQYFRGRVVRVSGKVSYSEGPLLGCFMQIDDFSKITVD
jgi:hypothetical protein